MTDIQYRTEKILTKTRWAVSMLSGMVFSSFISAQPAMRLLNVSLTNPDEAVLYTEISNTLVLKGDPSGKYLRMERSSGPIEMRAGTAITTRLKYDAEGTDTLRIYSEEKLILEKIYSIRQLGEARASLKNNRDTVVSYEDIVTAGTLEIYYAGTTVKPLPANRGFTATVYTPAGKLLKTVRMDTNIFNDELKDVLKKAAPGAGIVFRNINTPHLPQQQKNIVPLTIYLR